jgi:RimJ/RimL family protein N-acetyltransferase
MNIVVNDQVHLSEILPSDKDALVAQLNDKDIYERTLRIPFPYAEKNADDWLELLEKITREQGRPVHGAIRRTDGYLNGAIGFEGFQLGTSHRAEIGYWLAKPYWGRGIMTAVVQAVTRYAFGEFGLAKITAHVFTFNPASARVLEKCGFQQEGLLRRHFLKDGKYIDAMLFALLKGD